MSYREEIDRLIQMPAYGLAHDQKADLYAKMLTAGTQYHREKCPEYGRFLRALGCPAGSFFCKEDIPFLPVSIFKELDLKSIPDEEVFKVITSFGTSGQRPSRIFLDAETSAVQQKVLARIVSEEIGDRRLPCLMLDTKSVLHDRRHFSARGAGILGFSVFASRICYALDENMELNLDEIRDFIDRHRQKALERGEKPKFLLYGFTFMIWQYFVRAQEAEQEYGMDGFRSARKLEKAAVSAMQTDEIASIRRYCGNELYVLQLTALPQDLALYKGGFGLFFETEAEDIEQIFCSFSPRIQTVVCIGLDPAEQAAAAAQQKAAGALRFVEAGQALQMDTVWDGIDLIEALSR